VTQFGARAPGPSPGQPEKQLTTSRAELDGESRGLTPRFVGLVRECVVRVEGIAVTAERADHEAALLDCSEQRATLACVGEQRVGIAVAAARLVARAKLEEEHREDAELHRKIEPRRPSTPTSVAPRHGSFGSRICT
jgi:hypothetical protein